MSRERPIHRDRSLIQGMRPTQPRREAHRPEPRPVEEDEIEEDKEPPPPPRRSKRAQQSVEAFLGIPYNDAPTNEEDEPEWYEDVLQNVRTAGKAPTAPSQKRRLLVEDFIEDDADEDNGEVEDAVEEEVEVQPTRRASLSKRQPEKPILKKQAPGKAALFSPDFMDELAGMVEDSDAAKVNNSRNSGPIDRYAPASRTERLPLVERLPPEPVMPPLPAVVSPEAREQHAKAAAAKIEEFRAKREKAEQARVSREQLDLEARVSQAMDEAEQEQEWASFDPTKLRPKMPPSLPQAEAAPIVESDAPAAAPEPAPTPTTPPAGA